MKKILVSCIAVLSCIPIMAQNTASLKMNLEKNKIYRFKSSSEQTITQTINGNQQTTESKSDYSLSLKMIDATADLMITEVHIDTMKTNTNTMGKLSSMSSVNEGDIKSAEIADVMSYFMNRISKNALYVKMDYSGKPIEVVNSKMLSDVVLKDTSTITLSGPIGAAIKKQIINMVSDNSIKTIIEMFTYYLPGRQVATGDNWNVNVITNSGGMSLSITTRFHLDRVSGNNAIITAESEIKAVENAEPIISGGAKVTYDDLKGLSKSNIIIDIRTGLLLEDKAKTHIAGTLGISAPGMSMQMPMDINSDTKVIALQ